MEPQILTHDEHKAAEAAFEGRPFNPRWSASARDIYNGLNEAISKRAVEIAAATAASGAPALKR